MGITNKIKIDDLNFGVMMYSMSYSGKSDVELERYNLFSFHRVKLSVARYVTMKPDKKKTIMDPLRFCFNDVWSRCEFEFMVSPWVGKGSPEKVDIFKMYVEPNAKLLMDMVNCVSVSSAKAFLSAERKRRNLCQFR